MTPVRRHDGQLDTSAHGSTRTLIVLWSVLLLLAMSISSCTSTSEPDQVFSQVVARPSLSLPHESAQAGQTIAIPVTLNANTDNYVIAQVVVEYDTSILSFQGATLGASSQDFDAPLVNESLPFVPVDPDLDGNVLVQLKDSQAVAQLTGDGLEIMVLTFKVADGAQPGVTSLKFDPCKVDCKPDPRFHTTLTPDTGAILAGAEDIDLLDGTITIGDVAIDRPSLSLTAAGAAPGAEVQVPVTLDAGTATYVAAQFAVEFDTSTLSFVGAALGSATPGFDAPTVDESPVFAPVDPDLDGNVLVQLSDSDGTATLSGDGLQVAVLTFRVVAGAAAGATTLRFDPCKNDCVPPGPPHTSLTLNTQVVLGGAEDITLNAGSVTVTNGPTVRPRLSMPDTTGNRGQLVQIPVRLDTGDDGVTVAQVVVEFNPSHVSFTGAVRGQAAIAAGYSDPLVNQILPFDPADGNLENVLVQLSHPQGTGVLQGVGQEILVLSFMVLQTAPVGVVSPLLFDPCKTDCSPPGQLHTTLTLESQDVLGGAADITLDNGSITIGGAPAVRPTLSMPDRTGSRGQVVQIPVRLDTGDDGVTVAQVVVEFNPSHVSFTGAARGQAAMDAGFSNPLVNEILPFDPSDGNLDNVLVQLTHPQGTGVLEGLDQEILLLSFTVLQTAPTGIVSPLLFDPCKADCSPPGQLHTTLTLESQAVLGGSADITLDNGSITIVGGPVVQPRLSLPERSANRGDQVEIPVTLDTGDDGVLVAQVVVEFNPSHVTFEGAVRGQAAINAGFSNPLVNEVLPFDPSDPNLDNVLVQLTHPQGTGVLEGSGQEILVLSFTVLQSAPIGVVSPLLFDPCKNDCFPPGQLHTTLTLESTAVLGGADDIILDNGSITILGAPPTGDAMMIAINDLDQWVGVDELLRIPDVTTGVAQRIGSLGDGFNRTEAIAVLPAGVGGATRDRIFAVDHARLLEIDPVTGAGTEIGPIGIEDVDGIAFRPGTATLYGVTFFSNKLLTIDIQSGAGTVVGSNVALGYFLNDLAFHPDGRLFILADGLPKIFQIDLQGRELGRWTLSGAFSLEALLWSLDGSTLYSAADRDPFKDLVTIDLRNGSGTISFVSSQHSGFRDIEGLAWFRSSN